MDSNLGLTEPHYKPGNSSHDRLNFALSSLASINSSPISISIEIWYERANADELAPTISHIIGSAPCEDGALACKEAV